MNFKKFFLQQQIEKHYRVEFHPRTYLRMLDRMFLQLRWGLRALVAFRRVGTLPVVVENPLLSPYQYNIRISNW